MSDHDDDDDDDDDESLNKLPFVIRGTVLPSLLSFRLCLCLPTQTTQVITCI